MGSGAEQVGVAGDPCRSPALQTPKSAGQSMGDASALRSLQRPVSPGEDGLHARNLFSGAQRCLHTLHQKGDNPKTPFLMGKSHRLVLCLETHLEMSLWAICRQEVPLLEHLSWWRTARVSPLALMTLWFYRTSVSSPKSGRQSRAQRETVGTLSMQKLFTAL